MSEDDLKQRALLFSRPDLIIETDLRSIQIRRWISGRDKNYFDNGENILVFYFLLPATEQPKQLELLFYSSALGVG